MTEVLAPPLQQFCGAVQTAGSQALYNVRHVRGHVKNGLHHASKVVEQVLSPLNIKVHGTLARISQPNLVCASCSWPTCTRPFNCIRDRLVNCFAASFVLHI